MSAGVIIRDLRKVTEVKPGFVKCVQLMGERKIKAPMDNGASLQMPRDLLSLLSIVFPCFSLAIC